MLPAFRTPTRHDQSCQTLIYADICHTFNSTPTPEVTAFKRGWTLYIIFQQLFKHGHEKQVVTHFANCSDNVLCKFNTSAKTAEHVKNRLLFTGECFGPACILSRLLKLGVKFIQVQVARPLCWGKLSTRRSRSYQTKETGELQNESDVFI